MHLRVWNSIRKASSLPFSKRHIGLRNKEIEKMLPVCNVSSIDELMSQVIPRNLNSDLKYWKSESEEDALHNLSKVMGKNIHITSYLGMGYHPTILPNVIKRGLLENPKWYTAYTPYQSEISQGRLESLSNFQTLTSELTKLPIANASLLDEATASVEVMNLSYNYFQGKRKTFFCSDDCHPQIINVLRNRSNIMGIDLVVDNYQNAPNYDNLFGLLFQYPNTYGAINVHEDIIDHMKDNKTIVSCNADIMSLVKLKPPGEFGVDICYGTTQRFGTPMWFGGPHAAYFTTRKDLLRLVPGRIINQSKDRNGNSAYRLALQTREQHIKKDKATSNICTSQALLANLVGMYSIYHGPEGLRNISNNIHQNAVDLASGLQNLGYQIKYDNFFDTICVRFAHSKELVEFMKFHGIYLRLLDHEHFTISLNETTTTMDCIKLLELLGVYITSPGSILEVSNMMLDLSVDISISNDAYLKLTGDKLFNLADKYQRNDEFLTQEVFNKHQTEPEITRYIYDLASKDYTLTDGMIPLGSCTMKLNSVTELEPLSWKSTQDSHPYIVEMAQGYHQMIEELGDMLCNITGFDAVSFQTNSGAMGEYTGLLCIKKYHQNLGEDRNICLIPKSAHGTNFASAKLAGLKVVAFDDTMSIDEFKLLIDEYKDTLSCMMITYPSTYGVFNPDIREMCNYIHHNGGLVYMDGANMNAQMGYLNPAICGADVCHLNLHKSFCIPHGGGGPGMGPILTNKKLEPFLPRTPQVEELETSIGQVTSSQWSSASILNITYLYLKMMGSDGLKKATQTTILNANYLKDILKEYYPIYYTNQNGRVGHEFILDLRKYKTNLNISEIDICKRLIDYSFHPPTMSWPVPGALMIEPTESETKEELDRFCDAMIQIYNELQEIEEGKYDPTNNVFKNSPHIISDLLDWQYPYSTEKAIYPVPNLRHRKFWPTVGRVDETSGDKQLLRC